jgi:hypothetical protein
MSLRDRTRLVLLGLTIADEIINEVRQHSGLTAMEITLNIFGRRHPYKQRVNGVCRRLVEAGHLERRRKGGPDNPFTYYLPGKGDPRRFDSQYRVETP